MGRQSRVFVDGYSVHVIQKGNDGLDIFRRDADYEVFLALLQSCASRYHVSIHGFVLMTNHDHLIVTPDEEHSLPRMMKTLGSCYVRYFNRCHARTGTLYNGRFRSFLIDTDRYWLTCLRYIEQNPVRAGIVSTPDAYQWSSYSAHAFGKGPHWLTPHPLYRALGATADQRQAAYRALCGLPVTDEQIVLVKEALVGPFTMLDTTSRRDTSASRLGDVSDTAPSSARDVPDKSPSGAGAVSEIARRRVEAVSDTPANAV